MKKALTCLLLIVLTTASYAQYGSYRDSAPGSGLYNTGKTMVWTGLGMAVSGAVFVGFSEIDLRQRNSGNDDVHTSNYAPVFALAGAGIGGGMALAGSLLMLAGDAKYERSVQSDPITGGHLVAINPSEARGGGMMFEVGGGIPPFVQARFIGGYHFSHNFFLGGGLGASFFKDQPIFPTFFADTRLSFTSKKVSPFVGIDLGGAFDDSKISPYGNFQAGARIRTGARHAWWISSYSEYAPRILFTYGLKVGYSF